MWFLFYCMYEYLMECLCLLKVNWIYFVNIFVCLNEFLIKENVLLFKLCYWYKINNKIYSECLKVYLKGNLVECVLFIIYDINFCYFIFVF